MTTAKNDQKNDTIEFSGGTAHFYEAQMQRGAELVQVAPAGSDGLLFCISK